MQGTFEYIERVQSGQIVGVRTGFDDFDSLTGGLNGGDLAILAARPSVGKTALALNFARNHAVDYNGCVAFFSLEMTKRELVLRLLLGEAQIDNNRFRNGVLSDKDWRRLTQAASVLENARILFDDSMAVTVGDLSAKARRLDREQKLSLLVIDYIQLVSGRGDGERREQQVADISRSLKLLAKDLDIPILALSQLNRGPENRPDKRPQLADLRESGAIEQDADIVMFVYRDEVYDPESPDVGKAEVIIAKQRNGPTGAVKFFFDKEHGRFRSLSSRSDAPPPEAGFDAGPRDGWGPSGGGGDLEPF
jgi:replicative DNA helicase